MSTFAKNLYGAEAKQLLSLMESGLKPTVSFVEDYVEGRAVIRMKVEWV